MGGYTGTGDKADLDNHSDQMNPNNDVYWESRGEDACPDDNREEQLENDED